MPMDIIEQKDKPAMTPLSADDLLLLVDLFYLPYNHGQKAKQIIADFKWLKFNAIKEDSEEFMELTEQEQKTKVWSPVLHFQIPRAIRVVRKFWSRRLSCQSKQPDQGYFILKTPSIKKC